MTINIKNFLNEKTKLSKMGEFQNLKQIEGLEMSSISADLYKDGRDDLALFYFSKGANYATLTTSNSITSEFIPWNNNSHKKIIKGLLVNTKNANTFTGKQGKESIDILAKNLSRVLTLKESKNQKGTSETVKVKDLIFASTGVIGEEFPAERILMLAVSPKIMRKHLLCFPQPPGNKSQKLFTCSGCRCMQGSVSQSTFKKHFNTSKTVQYLGIRSRNTCWPICTKQVIWVGSDRILPMFGPRLHWIIQTSRSLKI